MILILCVELSTEEALGLPDIFQNCACACEPSQERRDGEAGGLYFIDCSSDITPV